MAGSAGVQGSGSVDGARQCRSVRPSRRRIMIRAGSRVRFSRMPEWVGSLPEESRRVFEFCLGRVYRVKDVDEHGLCVLDVSADVDQRFGGVGNDVRLEAEFLEELS